MPLDAPATKRAATEEYGARVVTYDRYREDRAAISQRLADEHGLAVVPPFDHRDVIAGQGTAALELFEEVGRAGCLFVPLGGGGLLAGTLLAAGARSPACKVYGVEPAAGDDGRQSLRRGERIHIAVPVTIADGAQTQQLGALTFPIIQRAVTDILAVEDAALLECMRLLAETMKLVVEPTGCLGFAGARVSGAGLQGRRVGVILSGGNLDLSGMTEAARLNRQPHRRVAYFLRETRLRSTASPPINSVRALPAEAGSISGALKCFVGVLSRPPSRPPP